jgi:hypothetical protein
MRQNDMKNLSNIDKASSIYESVRKVAPQTKQDLYNYVKVFLGIDIPSRSICPDHCSPLDYLWYVYRCDLDSYSVADGDAVVWANRGGGKTRIAAVATLLESIFRPGCQTRILGGSLEQSSRMYEYLVQFVYNGFEDMLGEPIRREKCKFANGSSVQILSQSSKSIRGQHIQKLRCDEVELFDDEVFTAAKFITKSTDDITAAMEVLSTMHRPYGLMHKLIADAQTNNTPIFKWCIWEVMEKCTDRNCSSCPLDKYCKGKAKQCNGYFRIDDCIAQMRRSSTAAFEAEMLCNRPSLDNAVFPEFDPRVHVRDVSYNEMLPLYRAIDFGFVNPFVCLWLQVDDAGCVYIIDEYIRSKATIDIHGQEMIKRTPASVKATFCDPAGAGRNDVTGTSSVKELRSLGINCRYKRSGILSGVELIRRAIQSGDGKSKLIINPKCIRLIEALQCYHYPENNSADRCSEMPDKDGVYDHPIDALRYFFIGLNSSGKVKVIRY